MKNLSKVIAITAVAAMSFSCLSSHAAEMPGKPEQMSFQPAMAKEMKIGAGINIKSSEKAIPGNGKMTDEEKAAKIEELKTDLAAKLEAGEITQDEYDEGIAKIEAGDIMRGDRNGRGMKGERPEKVEMTDEEKAAKIEELKTDLAAKLEAGEITQDEYDEGIAKIEAGDIMRGDRKGRGMKGERPEKVEMTDEEKTAIIEELKTDLAAKLEAGEITQEEYDEKLSKIESGDFKPEFKEKNEKANKNMNRDKGKTQKMNKTVDTGDTAEADETVI